MKPTTKAVLMDCMLTESVIAAEEQKKVLARLEALVDLIQQREAAREKEFAEFLAECGEALLRLKTDCEYFKLLTDAIGIGKT